MRAASGIGMPCGPSRGLSTTPYPPSQKSGQVALCDEQAGNFFKSVCGKHFGNNPQRIPILAYDRENRIVYIDVMYCKQWNELWEVDSG